jgi:hypothetical protein
VAGACTTSGCPVGQMQCAQGCVDTQSSAAHCGGCNQLCAAGELCSSGTCQCRTGPSCGGGVGGMSGPGGVSSTTDSTTGVAGSGGTGAVVGENPYPCDGDTSGYDAVMTQNGNVWQVTNGGSNVYDGGSMASSSTASLLPVG